MAFYLQFFNVKVHLTPFVWVWLLEGFSLKHSVFIQLMTLEFADGNLCISRLVNGEGCAYHKV